MRFPDPDLVNRLRTLEPGQLGALLRFLQPQPNDLSGEDQPCANHPRPIPAGPVSAQVNAN